MLLPMLLGMLMGIFMLGRGRLGKPPAAADIGWRLEGILLMETMLM